MILTLLLSASLTRAPEQCAVTLCRSPHTDGPRMVLPIDCFSGWLQKPEAKPNTYLSEGSKHFKEGYKTRVISVGRCNVGGEL